MKRRIKNESRRGLQLPVVSPHGWRFFLWALGMCAEGDYTRRKFSPRKDFVFVSLAPDEFGYLRVEQALLVPFDTLQPLLLIMHATRDSETFSFRAILSAFAVPAT